MTAYLCAVCGTLALPTNSDLVEGMKFVHRSCKDHPDARHEPYCYDDDGKLDCACGLTAELEDRAAGLSALYTDLYDPDDVEPMGGSPWWRERDL